MEVKGAGLLYAMAGLMVTFAGFSALLLAIRQAAGSRLSLLDRYLAKTVLIQLFMLTGGAILPPLLALYELPELRVWQAAAVLFGVPMLLLLLSYPRRRLRAVGKAPPPIVLAVFVILGAAAVGAMLICVFSGLPYAAGAYVTALAVNFFTTAFAFVTALDVIMQQPSEAHDGV